MTQNKGARFNDSFNPLKVVEEVYQTYDWAEFTIATGTTDYDVAANQSAMFSNVKNAWLAIIHVDQDVTIRFNDTTLPAINHLSALSPWEWRNVFKITNIYITNNSGSTVNVKILLV